jgi:hypothetical protein
MIQPQTKYYPVIMGWTICDHSTTTQTFNQARYFSVQPKGFITQPPKFGQPGMVAAAASSGKVESNC